MGLLVFYLLLALLVSFLCSILEASLLSFTPSYIESLNEEKPALSRELRTLKDNVDKPLAAILSLNTIAHTVGAAGVGAQAALVYQNVSTGVISGILTIAILVFSEIIPKSLGAKYWRQLAFFTAKTLKIMIWVMYPLVLLSSVITRMMGGSAHGMVVSREELSAMADIGHQEGVFAENEMRIIKNLIAFQNVQVRDVMTPRTVVVMTSSQLSLKEVYANKQLLRFSRIPVFTEERDNVIGYFHKHELLEKLADDQHHLQVREIVRSMMIVPDRLSIPVVFEQLMEKREHIALAVDEYGGLTGVVTIEDIMETLLGIEIVDEFDSSRDMQEYARQKWQERARALGILTDQEDNSSESLPRPEA
jgi:CBS domain containing-hemolysin-like protein